MCRFDMIKCYLFVFLDINNYLISNSFFLCISLNEQLLLICYGNQLPTDKLKEDVIRPV